jgi:superfamily II DNA/RNA helicase
VPLTIHYEPYSDDLKRYDLIEEEKVNKGLDIIEWYKDDKFLVFAHTKRTGEIMKRSLKSAGIEAEFHNADLGKQERISLEQRFKNEKTPRVVVATSTLAWGCYAKGTTVLMQSGLKKSKM